MPPRGKRIYTFRRPARKWQIKALKKLIKRKGGAVFAPMRSGKSKVAVDFAGIANLKWGVKRVLIVAPLSAIGGWKKTIRDDGAGGLEWKLINYERLWGREPDGMGGWWSVDNEELEEFKPQLIIVDESHRMGDASTLSNKKAYRLKKLTGALVVILTGTPFHRRPEKLFGQFKLVNDSVFGTSKSAFETQVVVRSSFSKKIAGYRRLKWVRKKIKPYTFLMEHVPPVPASKNLVTFELQESKTQYEKLATEMFLELPDGDVVEPANVLVAQLRLSQASSGRVKAASGRYRPIGREKQRAFSDWVQQMQDSEINKFVVGARFIFELADSGKVCRSHGYRVLLLHGGVPGLERERRIDRFHEMDEPVVFVSQIATGALGVDLSAADTMMMYSLDRSLVNIEQFMARIRKFQDQRTLSYYFMCGQGTMDENNLLAWNQGMDVVNMLARHPKLVSFRGLG